MQKYLIFLLFFVVFKAYSQDTTTVTNTNYCGTMPSKAAWWIDFQRTHNEGILRGGDSIIYIPMTIHLLGTDANKGYMTTKPLLDALCQLNKDFEAAKIQFYIEGAWHKIAKSAWDTHKTVKEGAAMMFANNVPNTVNIYVVTNPAGNCGYNLPYAGIALHRGCITGGKHTWAHEMGHALSLNHPFLGWEGNKLNYSKPAPKKLTYNYTDFKETFFANDTLIIDTAYVELMDTSNCTFAADGFCDTRPDYLNYRWECDTQNFSTQQQTDPNGVSFYSDGTLIMSYSADRCQTRFSEEEIAQMRFMVKKKRPEWVHYTTPQEVITAKDITLLSPINNQSVQYNYVNFAWESVEYATHYHLQVSRLMNFSYIDFDTIVTAPKAFVSKLLNNKTFYWRVRPFNNSSPCVALSSSGQFQATIISNVNQLEAVQQFSIFPNPVQAQDALTISFECQETLGLHLRLTDVSGRIVQQEMLETKIGKNNTSISTQNLANGLYFVELLGKTGRMTMKVLVNR